MPLKKHGHQNQLVDRYLAYGQQEENQNADNRNYEQRIWEFGYKIQYEEPLFKAIE